jgi:hypothetical protein
MVEDKTLSFVYKDSQDSWWFAIYQPDYAPHHTLFQPSIWLDSLLYVGPCATEKEARDCYNIFGREESEIPGLKRKDAVLLCGHGNLDAPPKDLCVSPLTLETKVRKTEMAIMKEQMEMSRVH